MTRLFGGWGIGASLGSGYWILGFQSRARFPAPTKKNGNRRLALAVIVISVDTIWTWMILTLMRWFKPRFGMTMRRLANWCADSIRLSRKWYGPIVRDELLRRISAK